MVFMKPQGSFLCTQGLATNSYAEPDKSNPQLSIRFP